MTNRISPVLFTIVMAFFATRPALADPLADEHLSLAFGVFDSEFDTRLRVDSRSLERGTSFGLEDDLDLDKRDRFARFDAAVRLADRHRVSFTYFDAKREHSARLQRELRFGDFSYDLDLRVNGGLEAEIAEILYRYAVYSGERVRAELMFGVHQLTLTARLRAELPDEDLTGEGRAGAKGPLPVLGAALFWQFADHWRLDLQVQALEAEVGDFDGRVVDVRTGVNYRLSEHFDLGLYYNYFDLDLRLQKPTWTGELGFRYRGPQAVVALRF